MDADEIMRQLSPAIGQLVADALKKSNPTPTKTAVIPSKSINRPPSLEDPKPKKKPSASRPISVSRISKVHTSDVPKTVLKVLIGAPEHFIIVSDRTAYAHLFEALGGAFTTTPEGSGWRFPSKTQIQVFKALKHNGIGIDIRQSTSVPRREVERKVMRDMRRSIRPARVKPRMTRINKTEWMMVSTRLVISTAKDSKRGVAVGVVDRKGNILPLTEKAIHLCKTRKIQYDTTVYPPSKHESKAPAYVPRRGRGRPQAPKPEEPIAVPAKKVVVTKSETAVNPPKKAGAVKSKIVKKTTKKPVARPPTPPRTPTPPPVVEDQEEEEQIDLLDSSEEQDEQEEDEVEMPVEESPEEDEEFLVEEESTEGLLEEEAEKPEEEESSEEEESEKEEDEGELEGEDDEGTVEY